MSAVAVTGVGVVSAFGLGRDVLALKPTVVTIDFGMNDARGGDARIDAYTAALRELIRQLKSARVRVIVLSPSPEQRNQPGEPGGSAYNRMLARYSDRAAEVASPPPFSCTSRKNGLPESR